MRVQKKKKAQNKLLFLPIRLSLKNQRRRSATCSRNLEIQLQSEIPTSREQVAGRRDRFLSDNRIGWLLLNKVCAIS
jgi:hypothetical protein